MWLKLYLDYSCMYTDWSPSNTGTLINYTHHRSPKWCKRIRNQEMASLNPSDATAMLMQVEKGRCTFLWVCCAADRATVRKDVYWLHASQRRNMLAHIHFSLELVHWWVSKLGRKFNVCPYCSWWFHGQTAEKVLPRVAHPSLTGFLSNVFASFMHCFKISFLFIWNSVIYLASPSWKTLQLDWGHICLLLNRISFVGVDIQTMWQTILGSHAYLKLTLSHITYCK